MNIKRIYSNTKSWLKWLERVLSFVITWFNVVKSNIKVNKRELFQATCFVVTENFQFLLNFNYFEKCAVTFMGFDKISMVSEKRRMARVLNINRTNNSWYQNNVAISSFLALSSFTQKFIRLSFYAACCQGSSC